MNKCIFEKKKNKQSENKGYKQMLTEINQTIEEEYYSSLAFRFFLLLVSLSSFTGDDLNRRCTVKKLTVLTTEIISVLLIYKRCLKIIYV